MNKRVIIEHYYNGVIRSKSDYDGYNLNGSYEGYYLDGTLCEKGIKKNNKKHGEWTCFSDGKKTSQGTYLNDLRDGYWEDYNENGIISIKGNYINGRKDGYFEEYFKNGILHAKYHYVNGIKNGLYEQYIENGNMLFRGNYVNNKKIGLWEEDWPAEYFSCNPTKFFYL